MLAKVATSALLLACYTLVACSAGEPADDDAPHPELLEDVGDIAKTDLALVRDELDAPTGAELAAAAPVAASAPTLSLWVAPDGADGADGSKERPLATLMGVHARLQALHPAGHPLDRNVEVRIAPGTYAAQEVRWELPSSGHSITFMPSGFEVGMSFARVKEFGGRPVFDGRKACDRKSAGQACKFFVVDQPKGSGPTRLRFYYLDVRNYATTGVGLHNDGDGLNLVFGCRFADIGTYPRSFRGLLHGMAALGLSDSDHNVVRNNHFVNIRNESGEERFLHAVYMNVGSDSNRIENNVTFRVSGDPIKVRQFSNHNVVTGNTLRCSGGRSFFLDYPEDFAPGSGRQDECASWENRFTGNRLDCGFDGGALPATYAEPGRSCGAPASWERFHVSDNASSCTSSCR
jgi:hypothetical protein